MRSIVLAGALAAPVCAVAATPNYTSPLHSMHGSKPPCVSLVFYNNTSQAREVRIGDQRFTVHFGERLSVNAPVGSVVRLYSDQNSKLNGLELMQVSANDGARVIPLK
jgi:hypothetical protein